MKKLLVVLAVVVFGSACNSDSGRSRIIYVKTANVKKSAECPYADGKTVYRRRVFAASERRNVVLRDGFEMYGDCSVVDVDNWYCQHERMVAGEWTFSSASSKCYSITSVSWLEYMRKKGSR